MAIAIPRPLIDYILLGPTGDRRQLQDSPILGDVWLKFGDRPGEPHELLITPFKTRTAGDVAIEIDRLIDNDRKNHPWPTKEGRKTETTDIAYLQGLIAARLYFDELLRVVVPITEWWGGSRNRREMQDYFDRKKRSRKLTKIFSDIQKLIAHWSDPTKPRMIKPELSAFDRYAVVTGLILWAGESHRKLEKKEAETIEQAIAAAIEKDTAAIIEGLTDVFRDILKVFPPARKKDEKDKHKLVYQISLNREVSLAVAKSVPAVKADAARNLFTVNCKEITWAVIDSGIQGNHPAFLGEDGKSRVQKSFDFSNYRKIVSLNNLRIFDPDADKATREKALEALLHDRLMHKPKPAQAIEYLTRLAQDVKLKRPIHWEFVEPFVEIKIDTPPSVSDHGTHVAGIIGANKDGGKKIPKAEREEYVDGMCPDIQLYDFRVIADSENIKDTEFAIIAALQYIRHVNDRHDFITIHGANLSLSIPHDVRNYACGRTPVCVECERLIDSGVVVVAAAGNFGYQNYQTKEGSYEGYAAFTITDPGNTDAVITVGATHRFWPHTYGVSFFSSRGPTGDGRLKPDLVAPGERIRAPFRVGWDDLDGTSMAAPHVSGAAAMLMARYSELIGQPRRIKQILCESATDLGRERSFQGHGMLDVLRAFQSI
jgi:hypothetical protein